MEKARRKINLCILTVVFVAVIVGFLYYFGQTETPTKQTEGTLISNLKLHSELLWE